MNITKSASILDWRTNTQGRWTAVVDDIAPSTQDISFGNGYTATVTNRKITVENPTRPSGTVTYAVEDVVNTAYAGNLAAVGSVKDTLDVVTGEREDKIRKQTFNGSESWGNYANGNYKGFTITCLTTVVGWLGCIVSGDTILGSYLLTQANWTTAGKPVAWIGGGTKNLFVAWNILYDYEMPAEWYDWSSNTLHLDAFKAWLAQHPLTVIYVPPAGEQQEASDIVPQPLSLSAGANTASITDTSTGGKPVFPMSYDGTDYAIATKSARVYLKDVDGTVERVTGVTSISVRGGRDNVMDLTRMFGSGLEPGTLDAFYSLFPAWRGYKLPYNEGSLLNFKGTGLKSVGFNLLDTGNRTLGQPQNTASAVTTVRGVFDETKYYLGFTYANNYSPSYAKNPSLDSSHVSITSTNGGYGIGLPIRVIPGQTYRVENISTLRFAWYTYNGTYISGSGSGISITAPRSAYWCMLILSSTTVNQQITWTNPCVHLQWSGIRNGDYEPYWDYTRPVPTLTYFPDGMNGRGNVYDEINDRQAIRRFGVVDLGTLEWTAPGTYAYWYSSGISSIVRKAGSSAQMVPIISSLYAPCTPNDVTAANKNSIAISTSGSILVYNGSTSVSPTGTLIYELATPVVTTFSEEISTTARISDFGTEECLPVNGYDPVTAPFRGMVLYQDDYARTITKLPENYQSQDSMDNLLALLGQLHNGTITATFDSANQVYTYQFTPNA